MDDDPASLMLMEDLEWDAFCQLLAKIGIVTIFGMMFAPVPSFFFCGLT